MCVCVGASNGKKDDAVEERERERGKERDGAGNTKGGSITVLLTSCLTGLE